MALYNLVEEKIVNKKPIRTFRNDQTGTECKLSQIYIDKEGRKWWGFVDLYKIPIMRSSMARNITDLYTIGLSLKDIQTWCQQEKDLLRSNDPEKYEKLYSLILEKEKLATYTADPMKQQLGLCTVYIIADDERVDYFDEQTAEEKLKIWKSDPSMVAFFLTWLTDHIQPYIKTLGAISKTVLKLEQEKEKRLQQ